MAGYDEGVYRTYPGFRDAVLKSMAYRLHELDAKA